MKFLCVTCDEAMKLSKAQGPDAGSLRGNRDQDLRPWTGHFKRDSPRCMSMVGAVGSMNPVETLLSA